jgi:hypothetical protein
VKGVVVGGLQPHELNIIYECHFPDHTAEDTKTVSDLIVTMIGTPLEPYPANRLSNKVVLIHPNMVARTLASKRDAEDFTTTDIYLTLPQ